jgi:cytochrome c oxidase subunit IV
MHKHVESLRNYFLVFAALLALTATTVGVSYLRLGALHAPAALLIASLKAALVILFFMHVLHGSRLVWLVIVAAVLFLGIMLVLFFSDYASRGWLPETTPAKQLRTTDIR